MSVAAFGAPWALRRVEAASLTTGAAIRIKLVVISGTFVYNTGGGERKLGPGSFLLEPAGLKHTSDASADSDLLFFEESDGPFDITPAK